jgi:hypothetical protein
MVKKVLGVDIGGVLIPRKPNSDGGYSPMPDAFKTILGLRAHFDDIVVVSHADSILEEKFRQWFRVQNFFCSTGIGLDRVRYCSSRIGKVPICCHWNVTHFIDDRAEVLVYLAHGVKTIRHLLLFQERPEETAPYEHLVADCVRVASWNEVAAALAVLK